jgi:hypothetical protein
MVAGPGAVAGGVRAVSDVEPLTVTPVAATPPTSTEVPPGAKPVPLIVSRVPPVTGPDAGETLVMSRIGVPSPMTMPPVPDPRGLDGVCAWAATVATPSETRASSVSKPLL